MRFDTRKFLKKYHPESLKRKTDKPVKQKAQAAIAQQKTGGKKRQVRLSRNIIYDMIKMRRAGISYWNITVRLHKTHNISLSLKTVTRKLKAALDLLEMGESK